MVTAEPTGALLTSNDVKAIRQCDQVSISHTGPAGNGEGMIRCIKKLEKAGPFQETEREYLILCESTVRNYTGESLQISSYDTPFHCHGLLYNYQFTPTEIGSLGMILKTGDELSLRWTGSRNGYATEAGLHMDSLHVDVRRGGKTMTFMLEQSVCPDNTARMIQER